MPRGDRTGPEGMGPMTGRAAGDCAEYDIPGYANPAGRRGRGRWFSRGFGRGFGRSMGWRNRFAAGPSWWDFPQAAPRVSPEQETSWLKARAAELEAALKHISERLDNLEQE